MKGYAKSFLLFFVLLSKSVCCQFNGEFIKGVLLDEESNEPVVFATVRLKGRALGVISNNDGGFKVPIEFQLKGGGLEISSMGYESQSISFAELKKNVLNKIYLRPSVFQLNETTVKARKKRRPTAKQIIRFALNRIPGNYQNNPFQLIGYYRDYQLKDEKYINLNESLIKVMDQGFAIDDYQSIQFGLYGYKKNYDFAIDSFAAKPYDYATRDKFIPNVSFGNSYISNELVLLFIHDAIRNHGINTYSFVYNMVDDFIKEHRFSRVKNVTYGDQKVYQIDFDKVGISFQV